MENNRSARKLRKCQKSPKKIRKKGERGKGGEGERKGSSVREITHNVLFDYINFQDSLAILRSSEVSPESFPFEFLSPRCEARRKYGVK